MTTLCPQCSAPNKPGARFCAGCGFALGAPDAARPTPANAPTAPLPVPWEMANGAPPAAATPNEEAETEEQNFQLFLTINRPATVYVAFSDGYAARPGWLQSFSDTGQDLTFVDQKGNTVVLSLYAQMFPAGQVVLGGNTPAGSDRHSMYTVVIQETP